MSTFGDWEPADSYSPDHEISALALARRIHENRSALDGLAGRDVLRWMDLDSEERELAVKMADDLVGWLRTEGTLD